MQGCTLPRLYLHPCLLYPPSASKSHDGGCVLGALYDAPPESGSDVPITINRYLRWGANNYLAMRRNKPYETHQKALQCVDVDADQPQSDGRRSATLRPRCILQTPEHLLSQKGPQASWNTLNGHWGVSPNREATVSQRCA